MLKWVLLLLSAISSLVTSNALKIETLTTYKHDEACFTQGLVLQDNLLYESCGLNGKSSIRIVNYQTGEIIKRQRLEGKYFAEGIAVISDRIFMLTWKNKQMLIFDSKTLKQVGDVNYETHTGEGWGLTYDNRYLIASDGSSRLTFYHIPTADTKQLLKAKHIDIVDPATNKPITQINELQYVNGYIYANIWYKDIILKIDSSSGVVVQKYDASGLYPHKIRSPQADCLNGIAYRAVDNTFLLTGKKWPKYYSVDLSAAEGKRDL